MTAASKTVRTDQVEITASGATFSVPVILSDVVTFDDTATFDGAVTFNGTITPALATTGHTHLMADITDLSIGTTEIEDAAVTYAKIQDVTADRLLGRTGTSGDVEELSLGTNLSFSGNTLNAGGGSKIIRNWLPTDASFPTSNYATLDTRNTHPVLDFDTGTPESVYFHGVMPDNYDGEGITVQTWWTATTETSGTVGWLVSIEKMTGLDIDGDSFASAQTITAVTVSATNGTIQTSSVNVSDGANMDSLAAGDLFRVRISRDTANDTMANDAELHMVEMRIQ